MILRQSNVIHVTFWRLEYLNDVFHSSKLNDLNILVFTSLPAILNLLEPLGFSLANLSHFL